MITDQLPDSLNNSSDILPSESGSSGPAPETIAPTSETAPRKSKNHHYAAVATVLILYTVGVPLYGWLFLSMPKSMIWIGLATFGFSGLAVIAVIRSVSGSSDPALETIALTGETAPRKSKNRYGYWPLFVLGFCTFLLHPNSSLYPRGIFWLFLTLSGLSGLCTIILGIRGFKIAYRNDDSGQAAACLIIAMLVFPYFITSTCLILL